MKKNRGSAFLLFLCALAPLLSLRPSGAAFSQLITKSQVLCPCQGQGQSRLYFEGGSSLADQSDPPSLFFYRFDNPSLTEIHELSLRITLPNGSLLERSLCISPGSCICLSFPLDPLSLPEPGEGEDFLRIRSEARVRSVLDPESGLVTELLGPLLISELFLMKEPA